MLRRRTLALILTTNSLVCLEPNAGQGAAYTMHKNCTTSRLVLYDSRSVVSHNNTNDATHSNTRMTHFQGKILTAKLSKQCK